MKKLICALVAFLTLISAAAFAEDNSYDHWQEVKMDSHVVLVPDDYVQRELPEGLGYASPEGDTIIVIIDFPSEYLNSEDSAACISTIDKLIEMYMLEQNIKNSVKIESLITNDGIKRYSENIMMKDGIEKYIGIAVSYQYGEAVTVVIESENLEESLLLELASYIDYINIYTQEYYDFQSAFKIDVNDLSLAQMAALRDQIQLAMMYTDEWQEVQVPIGAYEIGVDIPAGHWNIASTATGYSVIKYADQLDESGKDADYSSILYSEGVAGTDSVLIKDDPGGFATLIDIELKEGKYLVVEHGMVIFTPYTGKPDLGFR